MFAALGASLLIGALVAPAMLRPIDSAWMRLAHIVSRVTTPIFLAVVYFVVITPVGLLRRRLGSNPLVRRADGDGFWIDRTRSPRGSLDRQF